MAKSEKTGFVYIWLDRKHMRFYIGSHWGYEDDGYICSSIWMRDAHRKRPQDFKRRILVRNMTTQKQRFGEEQRWLNMIKPSEIKPKNEHPRYYNFNLFIKNPWYADPEKNRSIGAKISASKKGKPVSERFLASREIAGKAISAKKKGVAFSDDHKQALSQAKIGSKRSEQAKAKTTASLKANWENNEQRRKIVSEATKKRHADNREAKGLPRELPTRDLCAPGERLQQLWADPVWAAAQREKLKEGVKRRREKSN